MLKRSRAIALAGAVGLFPVIGLAAPYASNISRTGTSVSFILNEPADSLTYSINGGPQIPLDGTTKGTKNFVLGSASDTFAISTSKNDPIGYTIPTGGSIAAVATGLSQATNASGFRLVSDDTNPLGRFNSPRGVDVSKNPSSENFGTAYVVNSAAGALAVSGSFPARTLTGEGLYALRADQSDAFAQGNTAANPGAFANTTSANSLFRAHVASDGTVYTADFSDAAGSVYSYNQNLTTGTQVLQGIGGPSALPAGQNHGSTTGVYVEGGAGGSLIVYTLDEDLTSSQFGAGSTTDKNSLWQYNIGAGALPSNVTPTKLATVLLTAATSDLDRGADGKWYLAQTRSAGGEAGIFVLSPDATTVLFDSLNASRTLLGNPTAADIFRNTQAMAVSPDQKWMAIAVNNSDVAVIPMINGIPDIANRLLVDTGTDVISSRDIAFDAVDNIYYVSSGQGIYRVLSPGGTQTSTLAWNGRSYTLNFSQAVPEPTVVGSLMGLGALLALRRRRS
jgi:hypothetical protein